ncbi:MAG: DUF167 domain-containing protein [Syntrophorhabdus sp.]
MKIEVKVIPNAKKRVISLSTSGIVVRLTAAPLEGKANEELIRFLSDILKIRKSAIKIIKGEKDRHKIIEIPMEESDFHVAITGNVQDVRNV